VSPTSLVLLPAAALLVGVLLQLLLARTLSSRGKGYLAFLCGLVSLAGVLRLYPIILQGQVVDFRLLPWDGPIALAYHVDGLSQLFALMGAGIGAAVLLYSIDYMAHDPGATRFYILIQLFIAGLIHLVYTADLFLLYLSWEVIGLCSFLLVGFWHRLPEASYGARKVLVMTHLAGYGLLAAVITLFTQTGSTLWTDPKVAAAFNTGIFLLVLVSAVAKSVQFPLHSWIPDAMAAPTPVSALLHAACYVKAGVYLVARLHSLGPWPIEWQTIVIWIGTVTMLVGVLYAMVQSDLKRLLAYHTVSQIGYMMLGLGLSTPLGIAAGLLHCLNHGLFKGGLFLCAGAVQHATGTRDMDRLGGLGRRMPKTTALWLVVAAGIAGVPLLNGFVSKWLVYNAALEAGQTIPALVAWIVSIFTVFSFLKATSGVFLGDETADGAKAHEAPRSMLAGTGVLAAGTLLLGVAPQLAIGYLIDPLLPALGAKSTIEVSWLGLATGEGSWFATGGLLLALVALGIGLLVYRMGRPSPAPGPRLPAPMDVFTGGEPLVGSSRLLAGDFSVMVKHGLAPFYRWVNVDSYYLGIWRTILRLTAGLGRASLWLEERAPAALLLLALGTFAAAALLIPGLAASTAAGLQPSGSAAHAARSVGGASWFQIAAVALAVAGLLMAAPASARDPLELPLLAGAGVLALLGIGMGETMLRLLLLEAAALVALVLVWRNGRSRTAAHAYLLAILLSAAATIGGTALLEGGSALPVTMALLLAGLTVKLALFPLYLWLPRVAESTPAPIIGLIVAVVDVAAFGELQTLRAAAPALFAPATPWLIVGVLSALGGGALMLAQRDVKRLLAFSTIEDMGVLLLGVTLGGDLGTAGAGLGLAVHALAKALLFSSLSFAEVMGPVTLGSRGLSVRFPVAGAGFLLGALAVLGVPPTLGYAAHWRLYSAAASTSPLLLGVLMLSTAMALLSYARVVACCWWGPCENEADGGEPALQRLAIVGLGTVLLIAGLWPSLLTTL
jgi:NADH:ubiquinone oxidoreductase subunit 5 (subunit L)/multisubunit Na+/H+ antiporter MnhA subunit